MKRYLIFRVTFSLLLVVVLFSFLSSSLEGSELGREFDILNNANTWRASEHNPFVVDSSSLPDGWVVASEEDFVPHWQYGFLGGWKKEMLDGSSAGVYVGVRRYTAWMKSSQDVAELIVDSDIEFDSTEFVAATSLVDLGVMSSGAIAGADWQLGEFKGRGSGNGISVGEGDIDTVISVFLQPRYANVYYVYVSGSSEYYDSVIKELEPFLGSLKIDVDKIPEDTVSGMKIPNDWSGMSLSNMVSSKGPFVISDPSAEFLTR